MLTGLFSMLQGMISRGKVTNTRIGPRTLLQITGLDGQTQQVVELLLPPGYSARPVAGADLLLLQVMGQADHVVALGGDSAGAAITDLAPGEFGMTDGAQRVVFRIGQYLELTSPTKVRVVSPRLECTGDIVAQCDGTYHTLSHHTHSHGTAPDPSV